MLKVNLYTRDSGLNVLLLPTHCHCSHCQQSRSRSRRRRSRANDEIMPLPYHDSHRCKQFFENAFACSKMVSTDKALSISTSQIHSFTPPAQWLAINVVCTCTIPSSRTALPPLERLSENLKPLHYRGWILIRSLLCCSMRMASSLQQNGSFIFVES
jgi:hypothetical protein